MNSINRLLLLILLMIPIIGYSQNSVTGKVVIKTGEAVEYAQVILQTLDSIAQKAELTDKKGIFTITNVASGNYELIIKYFSENIYSQKVKVEGDLNLGNLLIEKKLSLEEVVITGRKPLFERRVDRLVFNVGNSIAASGGNTMDALKVTPRINVQKDQISMIGKSELGVMINDKNIKLSGENLIRFLESIPSDNIKSIEVITTPPAKYDAEGNSGLINIVLKKTRENYWSSLFQTFYEQSTYPKGGIMGNFNYNKNKFALTTYLNYSNGSYRPKSTNNFFYEKQTWEEKNKQRAFTDLVSGRVNLKYNINDKWTLGTQITAGNDSPYYKSKTLTKIKNKNTLQIDSLLSTNNITDLRFKYIMNNVYSDFKLDSLGKKLSINFDYFNYNTKNDNLFSSYTFLENTQTPINNSFFSQHQFLKRDIKNYSTNFDFKFPYDWATFSFGTKLSFTRTKNNTEFYNVTTGISVFDPKQSNIFTFDENIIAFYISAFIPMGDKWETQLGLRYENTHTKGFSSTLNEENTTNYSELFPTISISYYLNDNNTFSLDYSRRTRRPRFSAVNPFREYSSKYAFYEGNPSLNPEFTHNIEFDHVYRNNLSSSLYYSFTDNGSSTLSLLNSDQVRVTKPLNYYKLHEIGLSEFYVLEKWNNLESDFTLDISWNKMVSELPDVVSDNEGWVADIRLYNIIKISKSLKLSLDFDYSFPGTFIDSKTKSVFNTNLGLRYNFMKNKMRLNVVFSDVFRSNKNRFSIKNNTMSSNHTDYSDEQKLRFTLSYVFGNKKIKSNKRKVGNKEEYNRVK